MPSNVKVNMTKEQFLQRFQMRALPASTHSFRYQHKLKHAAVLVPIVINKEHNQLNVLLTRRASHLKHHAGQISFPGGKVEPSDTSLIATALRETEEEIGLKAEYIQVLGQLPVYQTLTGYEITPVIAFTEQIKHYPFDKNEVAEVFQVPLSHFLIRSKHVQVPIFSRGKTHNVHFMPYQEHNIWGATAAILHDLSVLLN